MDNKDLQEMKKLVREKDICVLATTLGDKPHCSLMAYVTDEDVSNIYMATQRNTTKFRNLVKNPAVSLLVDTREEHSGKERGAARALTVDGQFHLVSDKPVRDLWLQRILSRHPHLKDFLTHPETELLGIRITSFLLLDGVSNARFMAVPD